MFYPSNDYKSNVICPLHCCASYLALYYFSSKNAVPQYDVVVVGAGIVGLASARELTLRYPQLTFAVVDKENKVGKDLVLFLGI